MDWVVLPFNAAKRKIFVERQRILPLNVDNAYSRAEWQQTSLSYRIHHASLLPSMKKGCIGMTDTALRRLYQLFGPFGDGFVGVVIDVGQIRSL